MEPANDLLTAAEVAEILRCDVRSVNNYRLSGRLKAEKYSRKLIRYRRSDVEAFRDESREPQPVKG